MGSEMCIRYRFYLITEPFGISIDEDLNVDLGNLIAAIDVVDRTLDTIEDKASEKLMPLRRWHS